MFLKNEKEALGLSWRFFKSSAAVIFLSMIPIVIGIGLFIAFGSFFYTTLLESSKEMLAGYFKDSAMGTAILWVIGALLTVGLYFIVSWTFVSIVTIIASPFNDLLSGRAIAYFRQSRGLEILQEDPFTFRSMVLILLNETKKISLILTLSIITFILGLIPLISPVSIFLNSLLLASSYMDYSWSRTNLPFSACVKELFGYPVKNFLVGFIFLFLITIPILNLATIPFMVIYFTMLVMVRSHEA